MPRPTTALILAMLALVPASIGSRAVVPRIGDAIARRLAHLAAMLPPPPPPVVVADDDPAPPAIEQEQQPPDDSPGRSRARARARRAGTRAAAASAALDVPADRVVRLTARQLRGVRATDAIDAEGHAIGARLHGVGVLGVGLSDGDIVTGIDGRATHDVSSATAAAMQAYASGEATARATVLRGGRTLVVTVHIPARDAAGSRPRARS